MRGAEGPLREALPLVVSPSALRPLRVKASCRGGRCRPLWGATVYLLRESGEERHGECGVMRVGMGMDAGRIVRYDPLHVLQDAMATAYVGTW